MLLNPVRQHVHDRYGRDYRRAAVAVRRKFHSRFGGALVLIFRTPPCAIYHYNISFNANPARRLCAHGPHTRNPVFPINATCYSAVITFISVINCVLDERSYCVVFHRDARTRALGPFVRCCLENVEKIRRVRRLPPSRAPIVDNCRDDDVSYSVTNCLNSH